MLISIYINKIKMNTTYKEEERERKRMKKERKRSVKDNKKLLSKF